LRPLSSERRERGEVVATVSRHGQPGGAADGRQWPYALPGERDWLLKRLSEQPDVTLRTHKVSYYAVWHFFEHEGISFKKTARERAGSARRRKAAGAMEKISGAA
jgi:transposase